MSNKIVMAGNLLFSFLSIERFFFSLRLVLPQAAFCFVIDVVAVFVFVLIHVLGIGSCELSIKHVESFSILVSGLISSQEMSAQFTFIYTLLNYNINTHAHTHMMCIA